MFSMAKNKSIDERDDIFINRLDNCKLLDVMEELYKKEYGVSAKKYLRRIPTRTQADHMLKTLESAPDSITEMFQRRLDCKCAKKGHDPVWTPTIPVPAIKESRIFLSKREAEREGFMPIFQKMLAREGCFILQ